MASSQQSSSDFISSPLSAVECALRPEKLEVNVLHSGIQDWRAFVTHYDEVFMPTVDDNKLVDAGW